MRDGDGMTVEIVKNETLGKESVDRMTDVRSVSLPSTQGMVRLNDVVDLLRENDDVPAHAVRRLVDEVDDDPSTGGHIQVQRPNSAVHTAAFQRVDIYSAKVDNERGSSVCGPDETWLKVVIPDALDEQLFEAVNYDTLVDADSRSELVEEALEVYLDETLLLSHEQLERIERFAINDESPSDVVDRLLNVHGDTEEHPHEIPDDELVAELEARGFDVIDTTGEDGHEEVDVCPDCEGHGGVVGNTCDRCGGMGKIENGGDDE